MRRISETSRKKILVQTKDNIETQFSKQLLFDQNRTSFVQLTNKTDTNFCQKSELSWLCLTALQKLGHAKKSHPSSSFHS